MNNKRISKINMMCTIEATLKEDRFSEFIKQFSADERRRVLNIDFRKMNDFRKQYPVSVVNSVLQSLPDDFEFPGTWVNAVCGFAMGPNTVTNEFTALKISEFNLRIWQAPGFVRRWEKFKPADILSKWAWNKSHVCVRQLVTISE